MVYNYKYFGVIFHEKCDFCHTCDVLAKGAGIALGSIINIIHDLEDFSFKSYETLYKDAVALQCMKTRMSSV